MGQIQNVIIILIITIVLSIVTLGLAYIFDLYLSPFITIENVFLLTNSKFFPMILSFTSSSFITIVE